MLCSGIRKQREPILRTQTVCGKLFLCEHEYVRALQSTTIMRWRRSSFKAAAAVLLAASLAPSSPRTYTWALVLTPLSAQQRQHNTSKHDRHRHHAPVLAFGPTFSVGVVPHQRVLFSGWPMTTMLSSGSSSEDPRPPKQQPVAKIEKVRKQLVPVKLRKPLGIQFEEVRAGFPGLRVADIIEGGSAIKNEVTLSAKLCLRHVHSCMHQLAFTYFTVCTATHYCSFQCTASRGRSCVLYTRGRLCELGLFCSWRRGTKRTSGQSPGVTT